MGHKQLDVEAKLAPADDRGVDGSYEPAAARVVLSGHERLRVLLVEDNAFVSDLFAYAVRKFEAPGGPVHDVMMARTAHEALRMLAEARPHLCIIDHYLPGMTGCDLLRRLRAMDSHEHTPVVVVSTGGDEVRREALAAGATLFMSKPVLLTQMLDVLRSLTSKEQPCL